MPTDNAYSLQDLADLADVSPRTIRYYVAQGLLPPPGQVGPGAHYTDGHLARLRLIRRLQREHLPLAEIRTRLAGLDDDAIASLVDAEPTAPPDGSALDYVRSILDGETTARRSALDPTAPIAAASRAMFALDLGPPLGARLAEPDPPLYATGPAPSARAVAPEPAGSRSQWDRISLAPDIELHVRRPSSRRQNKQVDRLIAIARELLEEDPS